MPSAAQGRATRERIVRVAVSAFADRGFRGASLDSIAESAGVTRQALLHYFRTKAQLLFAALDQRDADDTAWGQEVAGDALAAGLLALLRRNRQRPEAVRLLTVLAAESLNSEHAAHDYFRERYKGARTAIAYAVAQEQANGRIAPDADPEALATAIAALLDGLNLQQLLDPDVDTEPALTAILQLIEPP